MNFPLLRKYNNVLLLYRSTLSVAEGGSNPSKASPEKWSRMATQTAASWRTAGSRTSPSRLSLASAKSRRCYPTPGRIWNGLSAKATSSSRPPSSRSSCSSRRLSYLSRENRSPFVVGFSLFLEVFYILILTCTWRLFSTCVFKVFNFCEDCVLLSFGSIQSLFWAFRSFSSFSFQTDHEFFHHKDPRFHPKNVIWRKTDW